MQRLADARTTRVYWLRAAAIVIAVALAMIVIDWHTIVTHGFRDVDDELRLVEVRDWLGGQGFFDLVQYRIDPPLSAAMHWSRLVDMPLAATILALRPLLGAAQAELAACVVVPLVTLAAILLLVGAIARRLAGDAAGLIATALGSLAAATTMQAQPLRIDHHGWEIAFSLLATLGLLDRDARRGGAVAGIAIAVALQISLEALPYGAALGAVAAFGWWRDPGAANRDRLRAYALALAGAELLLFAGLRAPADLAGHCDAISPPHLLALAVVAGGTILATLRARGPATRGVALALVAAAAGAALPALPPHCGADAFSALEPIVRTYWYDRVAEGLPVWRQTPVVAATTIGFPLVGLAATAFAVAIERRRVWIGYALLLLAATAIAVLVQRAGGLANALAVPAAAWATVRLIARVQRSGAMPVRVLGSFAAVMALSPVVVPAAAYALDGALAPSDAASSDDPAAATACYGLPAARRLAGFADLRILAPLDLGPGILLETPHAVLASGHHRNHAAIADELHAWLGGDAEAAAVVRRHRLNAVLICSALGEIRLYRHIAPDGFAAHLAAGRAPSWLAPVPLPGSPLRLWRVID